MKYPRKRGFQSALHDRNTEGGGDVIPSKLDASDPMLPIKGVTGHHERGALAEANLGWVWLPTAHMTRHRMGHPSVES